MDGEDHGGEADGFGGFLLAVDGELFDGFPLMAFHEFGGLDEHAA